MYERTSVAAAAVLALGIIAAAGVGGYSFYSVRALSNTLAVTGSATATTTANVAKWTVSVNRSAGEGDLGSVQLRVSSDAQAVENFFIAGGIAKEKIIVSPVFVDRDYSNDPSAPRRYNVRQEVRVESNSPQLIDRLSKDINSLISRGVIVSVQPPEYFVSDLPDMRIALIGKAVTDAKRRAEEIAKSTGQKVGRLQSASSGVVQVMAPNSIDVSDYGSYDTSTIEKQVMVTARATFLVR